MTGVLLAGVDVGTTNTKVGLYDGAGTSVVLSRFATPDDADALVAAVCESLACCVDSAGRRPDAVGIASMAETGVPLDSRRRPLRPMVRWDDPRGAAEAAGIASDVGAATLFAVSGANLGVKTPLVRWRWLARHEPETFAAMRAWVGAADLIATALTGEPVTDPTLAARTGGYDTRRGQYHDGLLAAADMTADRLPRVVGSGAVAGAVTSAAADRSGLRAGTPVVVAGHDHLVGAYAAGVRRPGEVADSLGTAEAVITVAEQPPPETAAAAGMSYNRTADGRHWCLLSGLPGAGRLVDWCRDNLLGKAYQAFTTLADEAPDRPTGIIVEPYLMGRAAPAPDAGRRLAIHGVEGRHTAADIAYAVLEGLCFQARWVVDAHTDVSGARPHRVAVFGGPTRNQAWLAAKADIFGAQVSVAPDPDAVCAGAALLAGRAAGVTPDEPVLPSVALTQHPQRAERYTQTYREGFLPVVRGR
ncbi:MAG: FGGY-family carbohydrate kinase [Micromonosporaceae bacterium]